MNPQDYVSPKQPSSWVGTIERIEDGQPLVGINEIKLYAGMARILIPPVLVWVAVDSLGGPISS